MQCKLCSATNGLISIFGGKCIENRDYIRKLVAVTTGIQFEANDAFNFICYNCVVQIYNFHVFKVRAVENEEGQRLSKSKSRKLTYKHEIQNVDDIKLPNLVKLKDTLANWLQTKQQTFSEDFVLDNEELSDVSTQTYTDNWCSKTTSTQTINDTLTVETQCYLPSYHEISTQTVKPKTKHARINCNLTKMWKKESCVQTESKSVNVVGTQTQLCTIGKYSSKTSEIGINCCLIGDTQESRDKVVDKMQETSNLSSNQLNYVQNIYINPKQIDPLNKKNEPITFSLNKPRFIHLSANRTNVQYNCNNDIITPNKSESKCSKILSEDNVAIKHSPLNISTIKEEIKSSTPSPCLSSTGSLHIITDESPTPNDKYLSPSSCNLLSIKKTVQPVKICKYCDHALYSKLEIKSHRRTHMICRFCKKTFTSLKKTGIHMAFQCQQRDYSSTLAIPIVRVEHMKMVQETWPEICSQLKHLSNNRKDKLK